MTIQHHDAPSPDSDERYVRGVLDSAMSGTRPPLDLPGAALSRGRRLRTRRRLAVAGAVAAAGVLATVAAPWLAGSAGTDPRGRADDLVATQPPAPLPQQPAGWWDMPATSMIHAVETVLPDGVVVIDRGSVGVGTPDGDLASSSIDPDLEGPAGPGSINIILYPGPAQGTGEIGTDVEAGCGGVRTSDRARCEELLDTAGDVIGRRLTERWAGGVVINEVVLRRDSGTVYAASANTRDDKWGADSPRSASRPPLTLDQLEDLVRNDVWVSYPR